MLHNIRQEFTWYKLLRWLLTFKSGHFLIASGQSWECEREDYLEDLIKTKYRKQKYFWIIPRLKGEFENSK